MKVIYSTFKGLFTFTFIFGLSACAITNGTVAPNTEKKEIRLIPGTESINAETRLPVQKTKSLVPVDPNMPTGLEREALNRFIREMAVLNILVEEAKSHENKDKRIHFNYLALKHDLSLVKHGVLDYLSARSGKTRHIKPISGDYKE